jgi:flagellar hook protein FlgE
VTTGIAIRGNLDQTAQPTIFDPDNVQTTSSFNTNTTIFDLLGRPIQIEIYFCKNGIASTQPGDSGDWTYHVVTAPQNLASAGDGTSPDLSCRPAEIATGTLSFDSAGRLLSNVTLGTPSFVPKGATAPQTIRFDFGNGTASGGSGLDGLTEYAATSAISFISAEPYPPA